jgi:hypothetical protein
MSIPQGDLNMLTDRWHAATRTLNDAVDEALKSAQDDAYGLGARSARKEIDELSGALTRIVETVRGQKCSISEFQKQDLVVRIATEALAKVTK